MRYQEELIPAVTNVELFGSLLMRYLNRVDFPVPAQPIYHYHYWYFGVYRVDSIYILPVKKRFFPWTTRETTLCCSSVKLLNSSSYWILFGRL